MDGGRGPHSMHGSVGDVDVAHFQHEHVRAAAEAMGTEEVAPMVEGGVPVVDQKANIWLQSACCGPTGKYSVTKCLLWINRRLQGERDSLKGEAGVKYRLQSRIEEKYNKA